MDRLTSLPAGLLVVGVSPSPSLIAFGARLAVRALVPAEEYDHVQDIAAPLMPALGAAFGVLIALTLASEAGYLKSAQDIVATRRRPRPGWRGRRQAQASVRADPRSPWATTSRRRERPNGAAHAPRTATPPSPAIATLERVVRVEAARTELGTPAGTELLASLDAVTAAGASDSPPLRHIPVLYVVTLVVGGVALIANAGALGFRSSVRTALLVVGLAIVVGLSLALLFSLVAVERPARRQRTTDRRRRRRSASRLVPRVMTARANPDL